MVIVINKNVTIHRIEDVVLIIGIVSAIILCMKSESNELVVNLLFCSQMGFGNKRLYQDSANMSFSVFSKTEHLISAVWKVFVMCFYPFKKWCEVVIRISEIIQLYDFSTISR